MSGHITPAPSKDRPLDRALVAAIKNVGKGFNLKTLLPFVLLIVVGSFFGATTVNAKVAAQVGWHPIGFLALSGTLGGLLMMAGLRLFGKKMDFRRTVIKFSLVSGLLFALPNLIFFLSVPHVGAGFVAMVTAFASVLTYVFSVLLRTEMFKASRAIGIAIALIGAVGLSLGKLAGSEFGAVWVLIALSGPVFLALGNIYRSWAWPAGASPFALAPLMLIVAGLIAAIMAMIINVPLLRMPTLEMGIPLIVQILIFAVGFAFYFVLQKIAGAVYLSQIGPIIALVGTGLGIILLGEAASLSLMLGGGAIVVGVLIFNFTR